MILRMHKFNLRLLCLGLAVFQETTCQQAVLAPAHTYLIDIKSSNINPNTLQTTLSRVVKSGHVQDSLAPVRGSADAPSYRLLYSDAGYVPGEDSKSGTNAYRAVIADYANRKTVYAVGDDISDPSSPVSVYESNEQPHPCLAEVAEAAVIAGLGPDAEVKLTMPPIINSVTPDGSTERIIHILGRPKGSTASPERYHVNLYDRTATKVESAFIERPKCKAKVDAGVSSNWEIGNAGVAEVAIYEDGVELWRMFVVRPSGSTSSKALRGNGKHYGSGVELLQVRYKGKSVLRRAHLPILNVEYLLPKTETPCGPTYRDWQNEEYPFECLSNESADPVTGFRRCSKSKPRTILDGYEGTGFNGVGFYIETNTATGKEEVVILSEVEAGWYRYVPQWRFSPDGVIRPRWGFGGVLDNGWNCVCVAHHHHAYWRLDFDIETPSGNQVQECNIQANNKTCQVFNFESSSTRNTDTHRHWEVFNKASKHGYALRPGSNDGQKSNYGVGDFWALAYDDTQFSDEPQEGKDPRQTQAGIDAFKKGRPIGGADVVVWYAAHFLHNESDTSGGHKPHIVGPDLIPITVH